MSFGHFLLYFFNVFQLTMTARDGGYIPKQDIKGLTVRVNRNIYAPRFNESSYLFHVNEDKALRVPFARVDAYDLDDKVRY